MAIRCLVFSIFLFLFTGESGHAETLATPVHLRSLPGLYADTTGLVVKIVDGDTYDLLLEDKTTIRVRMNGIDAPEKGQAYGRKAKEILGSLCFQKTIRITVSGKDRYGRMIAESFTEDGQSLSKEMVRNGFAWQFKKYSNDKELAELEASARSKQIGLWADPQPQYPPDFRVEKKARSARNKLVAAAD